VTELLAAVIGAAFAYAFTWLQQDRERDRARRSLATVLLSEVRDAEATLRGMHIQPLGAVLPTGAFDLLTSSPMEAIAAFSPGTVQQILAFGAQLKSAIHELDQVRITAGDDKAWHAGVLTATIENAIHLVPGLKHGLEKEGGTCIPLDLPRLPAVKPGDPRPAPLPPSPFGNASAARRSVALPARQKHPASTR
jgi:hypothetical protein